MFCRPNFASQLTENGPGQRDTQYKAASSLLQNRSSQQKCRATPSRVLKPKAKPKSAQMEAAPKATKLEVGVNLDGEIQMSKKSLAVSFKKFVAGITVVAATNLSMFP